MKPPDGEVSAPLERWREHDHERVPRLEGRIQNMRRGVERALEEITEAEESHDNDPHEGDYCGTCVYIAWARASLRGVLRT